ncbi:MAG: 1-(5-phosphoribosyl)-5-[(5-phosphoribosylamino)methylideneamino]imidazole-4-carboxamide isomerase [Bacteroidales bacterium]|nr:1-(5-phosphoribosyl)-5-[(5-phosphoribosylamino)methylideneamino]imidazole-4-carboxamide isomerase [Bacteroidales bacterium]
MIEIIPAIDIINGRCVRLSQGNYNAGKVYDASPEDMARRFEDAGMKRLHLVDLDGAKSAKPQNLAVLERIATFSGMKIEWGGGIKTFEALHSVFDAGANYAVCGSVAVRNPELMIGWLEEFGPERIVLGADVKDGKIAVAGWLEQSEYTIESLVEVFLPAGLSQLICTDISRDGMLEGPAFDLYCDLQAKWPAVEITVSGGISGMGDIEKLSEMGLRKVIVGKAIYEGRITLKDLEKWSQNV